MGVFAVAVQFRLVGKNAREHPLYGYGYSPFVGNYNSNDSRADSSTEIQLLKQNEGCA